jgi:non-canonical poly(A) RNA polymerase PAPD5/7
LKQNLASAAFNPSSDSRSLLGAIIGADYDSYDEQRKQLHDVFMSDPRFSRYWPPPPAPPASPPPPPPPPQENPPVALKANQQQNDPVDVSKLSKKQVTAYERANRLRSLRPDLEFVPNLVTVEQAMQVGGYATISNMDRDLHAREKARKEQAVE